MHKTLLARIWTVIAILSITHAAHAVQQYDGEVFTVKQPDGSTLEFKLYGNNLNAVAETLDGYTIVRDPDTREICFATLSPNKEELISTGVRAGGKNGPPPGLAKKLRLSQSGKEKQVKKMKDALKLDSKGRPFVDEPEASIAHAPSTDGSTTVQPSSETYNAPPSSPTTGKRVFLALLIKFPDRPQEVVFSQAEVDDFYNKKDSYLTGDISIYDRYMLQSNGMLEINNIVTAYYEAQNPKDYYTDNTSPGYTRARELINEAITHLGAQGFDFSQCDGNNDGIIDGVNAFYTGQGESMWAEGLWPHASSSYNSALLNGGLSSGSYRYQMTYMKLSLPGGTVAHEIGHMACRFPDLYGYSSWGGVSFHCMMSQGVKLSPYLRYKAGWGEAVEVSTSDHFRAAIRVDSNRWYIFRNPSEPREYFIIDNWNQNYGYATLFGGHPDDGLNIWHCYETRSNTYPTATNEPLQPYIGEGVPEDALGTYRIENGKNGTDRCYFHDHEASDNVTAFTTATVPNAYFWKSNNWTLDTNSNGPHIHSVSGLGETMTFIFGAGDLSSVPTTTSVDMTSLDPACDYGTDADADQFIVWNKGSGTLSYTISENASWLSLSGTSGTATEEADVFTVTYNTAALAAGTHTATISVDGGTGGIVNIPVTLTVRAQGEISTNVSSVTYSGTAGQHAGTAFFQIHNAGGSTLNYTLSESAPWLSLSRTEGEVRYEYDIVDLRFDATELAAGTYNATITIGSPNASNAPYSVNVTFNVSGSEILVLSPDGGETVIPGQDTEIRWASVIGGNVKIDLYKDGSFNRTLITSTPNDGSYIWTIPSELNGPGYTVLISTASPPNRSDESNASFFIKDLVINTAATLPEATLNQPYSVTFNVTGGITPYTWNAFDNSYTETVIPSAYVGGGVAQGGWGFNPIPYTLPFDFKFFGVNRKDIRIAHKGYLDMEGMTTSNVSLPGFFDDMPIIAVLDSYVFDDATDQLYITENLNHVIIRWEGIYAGSTFPGDFEVMLYDDGTIIMNYGNMNELRYASVIGLGDGLLMDNAVFSYLNDQLSVPANTSIRFDPIQLPEGLSFDLATGVLSGTPTEAGTYSFKLSVTDSSASPFVDEKFFTMTVTDPNALTYDIWTSNHGLSGNLALGDADPDRDGVVNLIEYAINADPTVMDSALMPECTMALGGGNTTTVLHSWQMNESAGTGLTALTNTGTDAGAGGSFDSNISGVSTDGSGNIVANNATAGNSWLTTTNLNYTSGQYYLEARLSEWNMPTDNGVSGLYLGLLGSNNSTNISADVNFTSNGSNMLLQSRLGDTVYSGMTTFPISGSDLTVRLYVDVDANTASMEYDSGSTGNFTTAATESLNNSPIVDFRFRQSANLSGADTIKIDYITINKVVESTGDTLTLTYRRNKFSTDIYYQVESSTDLQNWSNVDSVKTTDIDAQTQEYEATIPVVNGRAFMRLKVLKN